MSISVTFRGVSYTIPTEGESEWATNLTTFLVALAAGQPTTAVTGSSTTDHGVVAQGDPTSPAKSAFRIVPQDAQPTGPNQVGDIYTTTAGIVKICTVAGTPGTWQSVGAQ
jgi:hypothetical protein